MGYPTTLELNWLWIAQAVVLPAIVAVLIALPFWWRGTPMTGTILGAGVIFVAVVAFIGREYITLTRFHQRCLALVEIHIVCRGPNPEEFTRFCVYGFIGMVQTFGLFLISASIDAARQRREYSPEWRNLKY